MTDIFSPLFLAYDVKWNGHKKHSSWTMSLRLMSVIRRGTKMSICNRSFQQKTTALVPSSHVQAQSLNKGALWRNCPWIYTKNQQRTTVQWFPEKWPKRIFSSFLSDTWVWSILLSPYSLSLEWLNPFMFDLSVSGVPTNLVMKNNMNVFKEHEHFF